MARDQAAAKLRRATSETERRRRYAAGVAKGALHRLHGAAVGGGDREYDDVTLARKVETEIFRPPDAPKGSVDVNVQHGVVELRGEASPEQIERLAEAAARVDGVQDVRNLLHAPA